MALEKNRTINIDIVIRANEEIINDVNSPLEVKDMCIYENNMLELWWSSQYNSGGV